jgi:replicative DNA helicase
MASLPDITLDRGLPASVDAERTILGAVLLDPQAIHDARGKKLEAGDFSLDSHRRIYARMCALSEAQHAIDLITVSEELDRNKELQAIGGPAYLSSLTEGLPRRLSIEDYVRIVKDKSLLRSVIGICTTAIARAADQGEEALDILSSTESQLLEATEHNLTEGFDDIKTIFEQSIGRIDELYSNAKNVTGLATHFTDLDVMTSGLQKDELFILAARPSMGKTALAINIAQNAAVRGGAVVGIFSLEMSKASLLRRLLASQSMVSMRKIQTGYLSREDREKLMLGLGALTTAKMFIDDTPGISLAEMRAKARRLQQQQGTLDLIVVDYLQLMSATASGPGAKRYENRTQEVSALSRGLKALAKELHVPVLALSQLSRASERRGDDKKPILSDLRESGSIEQDADIVAFIHRDSYYERDNPDSENQGKAELIIAKQRNGPTGLVNLAYVAEYTLFANAPPPGVEY